MAEGASWCGVSDAQRPGRDSWAGERRGSSAQRPSGITPIARVIRKSHKDDSVNYEATTKQLQYCYRPAGSCSRAFSTMSRSASGTSALKGRGDPWMMFVNSSRSESRAKGRLLSSNSYSTTPKKDVAPRADRSAGRLLRRHVRDRAEHDAGPGWICANRARGISRRYGLFLQLRHAEVGELRIAVGATRIFAGLTSR